MSTADSKAGSNGTYSLDGNRGVVVGKLFRRNQLGQTSAREVVLDADASLRVLRSNGHELVTEYWGRYVAFITTSCGATRILRDPSGTLPCFQIKHLGVSIVFSWLEDVLLLMEEVALPHVNWDGISAQLQFGEISGHLTALAGVTQVLPGQAVDSLGRSETRKLLWRAVELARSPSNISIVDARSLLRETVQGCIRSWASCYDGLVLRLSGGVDSSIVLSCLTEEAVSARVICLNYYFPGSSGDERGYARLAATKLSRQLIEIECKPDVCLDRVLGVARTPTPANYIGRIGMARTDAAVTERHGAAALFTGGGGDQLFYEFRQWWPAADRLRICGVSSGLLSAFMDAARLGKVSVWNAVRNAIAERLQPTTQRQDLGRHLTLVVRTALTDSNLQDSYVHPDLIGAIDLPIGKLVQTQQLMYPLGYYDPFELQAAPELVNPLLSQPLVELALRLPTYVLTHGGRGRSLARQAFAADLPTEISTRRSKGGLNRYAKGVLDNNIAFAKAMLLEGNLMRRGFLDRARLEDVLSDRPSTIASHVSEIHMLIGVEAWLALWTSTNGL